MKHPAAVVPVCNTGPMPSHLQLAEELGVNPRSLGDEAEFFPESIDDLVELRRRLMSAGHSASVANGIVGWVLARAHGEPDPANAPTRSRYRKILRELERPPKKGPPGPRRGDRSGPLTNPRSRGFRANAHNPRLGKAAVTSPDEMRPAA